jgi:muramoyltetrapeptide carboxypeptidase LdcA involved in peptidoglycan recycling
VQIGPGPAVDAVHLAALRAALLTGERLEVTEPGESEDIGREWTDPLALTSYGDRRPTEPWTWAGPRRVVTGRTWGGCIDVLPWLATAGRFPDDLAALEGGVLLLEASEEIMPAREFGHIVRSLGERGLLEAVDAVVVARPPTMDFEHRPSEEDRAAHRAAQRDVAIETVHRYHSDAVVVVGVPFGHTRPQWVLPYGGDVSIDSVEQRIWADFA